MDETGILLTLAEIGVGLAGNFGLQIYLAMLLLLLVICCASASMP